MPQCENTVLVEPVRIFASNVILPEGRDHSSCEDAGAESLNCTLTGEDITNMRDNTSCFLMWHKSMGTVSIQFENAPEIFTVRLWYYENTENGLPHITLRNSSQNLVYSSSGNVSGNSEPREISRDIAIDPHFVVTTSLNMTFDLTSGDIKEFCLRGVDFFTCRKLSQCVHACMPASFPQTLQENVPSYRFQLIAH